ncbi:MAG: B12-binding domain-containing radical SAM protein [Lachnospiraceae bacterium]|nr:B12-binding domain-containing radical SAM protein [Lachnospiraceae bacterium]
MKVALLAPAGAMHRYNGMFSKNLHYAPITLALLAALIPREVNPEPVIYDETAEPIPLDLSADIVCITCITGTATRCYRYADYFRSRGLTVIIGGVHPTVMPKEAKQHADSVMIGLGDETFPQAIRDFVRGELKEFYEGHSCTDISGRPLPRKDLLKKSRYITLNTVECVRGCNHTCSFCAYPSAFGHHVITRPVKDVIDEIKTFRGKVVIFPDVNLIADIKYAKELFTAMIPLKKWWFGLTTTAIGHNDELLEIFKKSGCKGILLGLESVNQETQKDINKRINSVDEYEDLIRKLHDKGILIMGCFAFGSDEDEKDVFERTAKLCIDAKIDLPRFSIITPFPGTPFYKELKEQDRITETDWSLYDVEHVVYKPANMTKQELLDGIDNAWQACYSWSAIFKRFDHKRIKRWFFIYLICNIGYRKYAKNFNKYDERVMTDNSDIPVV